MEQKNNQDNNHLLLLHYARFGSLEKVKDLIEGKSIDVNSSDTIGRTALHRSSYGGFNQVVKYLLLRGANIDCKTICSDDPDMLLGATPLAYAVMCGHTEVARTLIENHANISSVSERLNLLDLATISNNPSMIDLVIELGFNINQEGLLGMTPLSLALVKDKFESVKFLLDKGANYRKYTTDGAFSPLVYSLQEKDRNNKDMKCTEFLLNFIEKKEGRDGLLDYINYNHSSTGRTALHIACCKQNYHAVKLLIDHGANIELKDKDNFLPHDLLNALEETHLSREIKRLLSKTRTLENKFI